jgi:hypothetical protein
MPPIIPAHVTKTGPRDVPLLFGDESIGKWITVNDFMLADMLRAGLILREDREDIKAIATNHARVQHLLDVIKRRVSEGCFASVSTVRAYLYGLFWELRQTAVLPYLKDDEDFLFL